MLLENPNRYNFHESENVLKKGNKEFIEYVDAILTTEGIDGAINILKSSGIAVNLFNSKKNKKILDSVIEHISKNSNVESLKKVEELKNQIIIFEDAFKSFENLREAFFKRFETIEDKYKVVSYLLSLEFYLNKLINAIELSNVGEHNKVAELYDSAVESTGMILKYFIYKKFEFVGSKRNISPKTLDASLTHVAFSQIWNELNDILEYWKYSDVEVTIKDNVPNFCIKDENFELSNLVSNERFSNLRQGWQFSRLGELQLLNNPQKEIDELAEQNLEELSYLFATLYFGSHLLNEKVENIELKAWIRAYNLLISESKKYLKKNTNRKGNNLYKICLVKTDNQWINFFRNKGYSIEDSRKILEIFTFDDKSQDLIDCPFIKIDNELFIIPSLTSQADASRALASNFLNRKVNLDFKGKGFEQRTMVGFELNNIKCAQLYKRVENTEYECDLAFVLDNELFFVECKAHVQPFTTRQQANHLYKLYKETSQLNRIADFFEENLPIVRGQLNLANDFKPKKIHRILLTTSMIGTPLFKNGVYIVDESSFTMLIDRKPPKLEYFEKGKLIKMDSKKFDVFKGKLTAKKMLDFLTLPPQISITRELYKTKSLKLNFFNIHRHYKANHTLHMGAKLNSVDKNLLKGFM